MRSKKSRSSDHQEISLPDFFAVMTLFYQCDAVSYTKESGYRNDWLAGLFQYDDKNACFIYDDARKRLLFSTEQKSPVAPTPGSTVVAEDRVSWLIRCLNDWWTTAVPAALELGKSGDARAVEPLIALLIKENTDMRSREAAAKALGMLNDARAVLPLIAILRNQDCWLRPLAAEALGHLKDPRVVGPLIDAVLDLPRPRDGFGAMHPAIVALGEIGDPRAVPVLANLLNDDGFYDQWGGETRTGISAYWQGRTRSLQNGNATHHA